MRDAKETSVSRRLERFAVGEVAFYAGDILLTMLLLYHLAHSTAAISQGSLTKEPDNPQVACIF